MYFDETVKKCALLKDYPAGLGNYKAGTAVKKCALVKNKAVCAICTGPSQS